MGVDHTADQGLGADDEERTDAYAGEGEARDTGGPAADLGEDNWVGDKAKIEDSIDGRNIEIPKNA